MERNETRQVLETLLFITDRPVRLAELSEVLGESEDGVRALIADLREEFARKGFVPQIVEVAGGFQMATPPAHAPWVRRLFKDKMSWRLSGASLETLSIIAYKQPITRAEIEEVRGVEVIAALETLLEKGLIRVTGRRETVGRPLLYGTTEDFLRHFGFQSPKDLPSLESFAAELQSVAAPVPAAAPAHTVEPPAPLAEAEKPEPAGPVWPGGEPD